MNKILSLVGDSFVDTMDHLQSSISFKTAFLCLRKLPLSLCQSLLFLDKESWVVNPIAVGECDETLQTNVDAHRRLRLYLWKEPVRFNFNQE